MLRRRPHPRQRQDGPVPRAMASTWAHRMLLLALAVGLVVMHHLVGAHRHPLPDPDESASSSAESPPAGHSMVLDPPLPLLPATPPVHAHAPDPAASSGPDPVGARKNAGLAASGRAALLHHHPGGDGRDVAMSWHACLAVLLGMALLVLSVPVAWWWQAIPHRQVSAGTAGTSVPRAPPLPLRLARLQVLRL